MGQMWRQPKKDHLFLGEGGGEREGVRVEGGGVGGRGWGGDSKKIRDAA